VLADSVIQWAVIARDPRRRAASRVGVNLESLVAAAVFIASNSEECDK